MGKVLSEIRSMFVEISGRSDLIQDGIAIGADFLINEGCKELDRRLFGGKTEGSYIVDLDSNQIIVPVPNCRIIKDVYIHSVDTKEKMIRAEDAIVMKSYYDEPKANIATATPYVYYPINVRPAAEVDDASLYNQSWALELLMESGHESFNALLLYPPPDSELYTLLIEGSFYSMELVNDGDYNFWTIMYPMTVVHAAMLVLERTYRNTEGEKDQSNAIDAILSPLNMDIVEEEVYDINQMEG